MMFNSLQGIPVLLHNFWPSLQLFYSFSGSKSLTTNSSFGFRQCSFLGEQILSWCGMYSEDEVLLEVYPNKGLFQNGS